MSLFVCPLCGQELTAHENALRCASGHSFDRAREGHVNLMPVQFKASKDPGDNREMVAARRRFLDAGYYAPIAAKLAEIVTAVVKSDGLVVDAGCGEGYYLDSLATTGRYRVSGFDISKWAVQAAARRNRRIPWAVASNRQPPYRAGSVDAILCLFGFPVWEAFRRLLGPGGVVILADPGPSHLLGLRKIIYPEVRATNVQSIAGAVAEGFHLEAEEAITFSMALTDQAAICDLLSMTPHAYRMPTAGKEALAQQASLSDTAEVVFRVLRAPL